MFCWTRLYKNKKKYYCKKCLKEILNQNEKRNIKR